MVRKQPSARVGHGLTTDDKHDEHLGVAIGIVGNISGGPAAPEDVHAAGRVLDAGQAGDRGMVSLGSGHSRTVGAAPPGFRVSVRVSMSGG